MTADDCVFCKIIRGEIPSTKVYEDGHVSAFNDIQPVAPTHILIVPNKHIHSVNDLQTEDESTVGHLFTVAHQLAEEAGIADTGYRLVTNTGPDGGQVVYHLHVHLLGGRKMGYLG